MKRIIQQLIQDALHPECYPIEAYHHMFLSSQYLRLLQLRKPEYPSIIKIRDEINEELERFKIELEENQKNSTGKKYQGNVFQMLHIFFIIEKILNIDNFNDLLP